MVTLKQMVQAWQDIFNSVSVEPDSDFFDLGGNSLHAIELIEALERDFGVILPVSAIWDESTPSGLCRLIREQI